MEMRDLDQRLEEMERQGVELERNLRGCKDGRWRHSCGSLNGSRGSFETVRRLVIFQIRRRSGCCWSGSACTTPDTCWCGETRSSVTCEWLRLRCCWRFRENKRIFLSFHLSNALFCRFPSPGQCSRGWRRNRPMWSTSSGASSTNKVGVFSAVT